MSMGLQHQGAGPELTRAIMLVQSAHEDVI